MEKNVESYAKKRTLIFAAAGALALAALGYVAINRPAPENDAPIQAEVKAPPSDFERTLAKLEEIRPMAVNLVQLVYADDRVEQRRLVLEIAIKFVGMRNVDYVAANVKSIKVVPFANLEDENASVKYFVRVGFANGSVRYYDEEKVGGYAREELSALTVVGELSEDEMPEITTEKRKEVYKQFGIE